MPFTPNFAIPYQSLADAPHGPNLGEAGFLVVDSALAGLDGRLDAIETAVKYTKIAESVLSGTAATVTFSSIPATYSSLHLEVVARGDTAALFTAVNLRFNNVSTATYDYVNWQGSGSGTSATESLSQTSAFLGDMPAASAMASASAMYAVRIPRYGGTTFFKTFSTTQTSDLRSSAASANLVFSKTLAGVFRSTAAINRIDLLTGAGNFVSGSSFTLYGLP